MNRRNFLRLSASAAVGSLIPSWLIPDKRPSHGVDLSAFCWDRPWEKQFEMRVPFVQQGVVDDAIGRKPWQQKLGLPGSHCELFRYATDGSVCVRVPIHPGDVIDREEAKLPPAYSLNWTHDWQHRGRWLEWPRGDYMLAADSECPRCYGTGDLSGVGQECERCGGTGDEWVGASYDISHPVQCRACGGRGSFIMTPCPDCNGEPIGIYPSIQRLEGSYSAAEYHRKIEVLPGVEYFVPESDPGTHPLTFRFAGGVGLLATLDSERARERLRKEC